MAVVSIQNWTPCCAVWEVQGLYALCDGQPAAGVVSGILAGYYRVLSVLLFSIPAISRSFYLF